MLNALLLIKLKLHSENKCCLNISITKEMYDRFNKNMYDFKNVSNLTESDDIFDNQTIIEIVDDNEFNIPCISL
jgi:hypothetical protein